jgi:signal transduction histidine kinase
MERGTIMRPARRGLEVTSVRFGGDFGHLLTCAAMSRLPSFARLGLKALDPRLSLATAAMWLIAGLSFAFSAAAGIWVGRIARANVSEQHIRRLALETDQLSSDLGQAVAGRVDAIRASERILRVTGDAGAGGGLRAVFGELRSAYPQYDWIAVADTDGRLIAAGGGTPADDVHAARWFTGGLRGTWLGVIDSMQAPPADRMALGDLAAPVHDESGRVVGVIATHLRWRRAPYHPERLTDESDPHTQAYVLDDSGTVLVGPDSARDHPWNGVRVSDADPGAGAEAPFAPAFERLPDGRRVLVSRSTVTIGPEDARPKWQVQLTEPNERVFQRARAVTLQILWVSLSLGAASALLGLLGARQLTARLRRLAHSVASVGQSEERLEMPGGIDEVARLAEAFAQILGDLKRERRELQALSGELERRVAVRTREVERLAEESRYAAVVRERLKIARDLHDTLAHSMMALLSEIRYLRRLQARDPSAVPAELVRAEDIAHEGLKEARSAISQMRVTAVRDTGLGPALATEFERFIDRTGLTGAFSADPERARFGDERAETLFRMAQEILRNVERHAGASRVDVELAGVDDRLELSVCDDGVGFDPGVPHPGHYGLVGLREQAELIGADLRIDSAPRGGTRVVIALRMPPMSFRAEA